jgi:sugar lactone lactonase YvrE
MTNSQNSLLRSPWMHLLLIAVACILTPSSLLAQDSFPGPDPYQNTYSGPNVDICNYWEADWGNSVEEMVCLTGDINGLDAYAVVDQALEWYLGYPDWPDEGGDPYVVGLGAEGTISGSDGSYYDTGMANGGLNPYSPPTIGSNDVYIPVTPNAWYSMDGLYSECYDSTGTGSTNCSWNGANDSGIWLYVQVTSTLTTPTVSLTTSATPNMVGQPVTFTATIANGPTSGTLTLNDTTSSGTTAIGTSTIAGTTAIFPTEALAVGNHSITAYWAGDSNTNAATSNAIPQSTLPPNTAQLVITPSSLIGVTGNVGASFAHVLLATGGTQPYTWYTGSLPPGLALNSSTGEISGTPTASGTFTFGVGVYDSSSPTQSASATMTVLITQSSSLAIVTSVLPSGYVGSTYNTTETSPISYLEVLQANGGTPPYAWSITSGGLPPGLTLATSTGVISGVPTSTGSYTLGVTVQDSGSGSAAQTYAAPPMAIAIGPSPLVTTPAVVLPYGNIGTTYSQNLQATGGTGTYAWSLASGSLPPGLSLSASTGAISGSPYQGGSFSFGVTVSDSGSPAQTLPIAASIAINTMTLPALGNISTVAGGGSSGYGGAATSAQLSLPEGVAVDAVGNMYIADYTANRILKVTATTGIISVVAGNGNGGYAGDGGLATNATIYEPMAVAVDSSGNLYIADSGNDVVRKVTASTGIITTVVGNYTSCTVYYYSNGSCGDGGAATSAQLYYPVSVAVDSAGNIYIADYADHRIRKVTVATGIISTVAGSGNTPGFSGDGGLATSAQLNYPDGVAVDSVGNIFIADTNNNLIREVNASTGVIATVAGNGTAGYSGDGGYATQAKLNYPVAVAVDAVGDIYIVDYCSNIPTYCSNLATIRKVTAPAPNDNTGIISTVTGSGAPGFSGDSGPATNAELNYPTGLGVDTMGNIYIADAKNGRIRVVSEPPVSTGILNPAYQVASIIYEAPGNKSSNGYSNSTSTGVTTSLTDTIGSASTIAFSGATLGDTFTVTGTLGFTKTSFHGSSFTETWADALGYSNPTSTATNHIDHGHDEFIFWMDPRISVALNGSTPTGYAVGAQGLFGAHLLYDVFAYQLEADPVTGKTSVDVGKLWPQSWPNQPDTPGLASVCRNLITAEYLNKSCTAGDQCGCQPSDFMPILALDPLMGYDGTTYILNANNTASCINNSSNGANCRFVPIPSLSNLTLTTAGQPASQSDSQSTTESVGGSTAESVGISFKEGVPAFSVTETETMTWTQAHSYGSITGSANTMNVNLLSTTPGCSQGVSAFEDTTYHTFAFQVASDPQNICP